MNSYDIQKFQNAVFVLGLITCAQAEIAGMIAANKEREYNNLALAYAEEAFDEVINRYGISYNDMQEKFRANL